MKHDKSKLTIKRILAAQLTSVLMLVIGCMIIAGLLGGEKIKEDSTKYFVMGIIMLSSCLGAAISVMGSGKIRILYCIGMGGIYFLILLAFTGLFFGGMFRSIKDVGATLLLIACGSVIAAMLKSPDKKATTRRRKHSYR